MKYFDITESIRWRFVNNRYHCYNAFLFAWESDYFSVTTTDYTVEVEIKVSKSDFRADFRKERKHEFMDRYKYGFATTHSRPHKMWDHHIKMNVEYCNFDHHKLEKHIPNRFYYACPPGIIDKKDVPHYAGLLYVEKGVAAKVIKQAPLLHKGKFIHLIKPLMNKFYWKYVSAQDTIRQFQRTVDNLNRLLKAPVKDHAVSEIEAHGPSQNITT